MHVQHLKFGVHGNTDKTLFYIEILYKIGRLNWDYFYVYVGIQDFLLFFTNIYFSLVWERSLCDKIFY